MGKLWTRYWHCQIFLNLLPTYDYKVSKVLNIWKPIGFISKEVYTKYVNIAKLHIHYTIQIKQAILTFNQPLLDNLRHKTEITHNKLYKHD